MGIKFTSLRARSKWMRGKIVLQKRVEKTPHPIEDYEDLKRVAEVIARAIV